MESAVAILINATFKRQLYSASLIVIVNRNYRPPVTLLQSIQPLYVIFLWGGSVASQLSDHLFGYPAASA